MCFHYHPLRIPSAILTIVSPAIRKLSPLRLHINSNFHPNGTLVVAEDAINELNNAGRRATRHRGKYCWSSDVSSKWKEHIQCPSQKQYGCLKSGMGLSWCIMTIRNSCWRRVGRGGGAKAKLGLRIGSFDGLCAPK